MKTSATICSYLCLLVATAIFVLAPRLPLGWPAIAMKTPAAGVVSAAELPGAMKSSPAAIPQILEGFGELPLSFEANQGQSDPRVKFISRGSSYALFLTSTESMLFLRRGAPAGNSKSPQTVPGRDALGQQVRRDREKEAILRIRLVGANFAASPAGLERLPGKLNYFLGSDQRKWRTDVPMFAKVRYEKVYPGVDLVYHGDHRQLEYDFIVAPGATPNVIRMSFGGLAGKRDGIVPEVDAEGSLMLRTSAGDVELRLPLVYQQTEKGRQQVSCRYAHLAEDQVGFRVGAYDQSKPLIIDPVLTYSTYLGGAGDDSPYGIAVDASGSAYVAGQTSSVNFPTTSGPLQGTFNGTGDAFITKLSPDGKSLIYSTYLGGSGSDSGSGIAVDSAGNAFVTGLTRSNDFPTTSGAFQTVPKGSTETAFVAKLAPDGKSLVYSTYLGGSGNVPYGGDLGNSIAVDPTGSAYVAGNTGSVDFPTTPGAFQTAYGGSVDAFVTKLAPDGKSLAYSTYLGGTGFDIAFGIAVDSAHSAYVTGTSSSTDFPTTSGVFQPTIKSAQSAFVSKLAPDGKSLVYSTYLGGSGGYFDDGDIGTGIAVDSALNSYATGSTSLATFPTKNAVQEMLPGVRAAFLTKFSAGGTALLYSTFLGGSANDAGSGVALDSSGNAYVTGQSVSGNFPIFPIANAVQSVCGGCQQGGPDAFVARIDTTQSGANSLVYSSFLGGTSDELGTGIAIDGLGNVYIAGSTSSGFPITPGALQASPGGNAEGFVVKISPNSAPGFTLTQVNLNFGNQGVGTSTSQTVVVGNAGTATLNISNVALTGTNSGEFSQSDTCGTSVMPGGTCSVTVLFSPITTGTKTAVITFSDDAANSPHSMNLLGASVIPAPALSLSPTTIDFGNRAAGSTGTSLPVTLANTGNVPVAISSIAIAGTNSGDFSESSNCPLSAALLGTGASCAIHANFKPTDFGNRAASLTITDSAPGSPHSVALTGIGIAGPDFTITASPTTATVTVGQSTSYTLTLTPVGGFNGTVSLGCAGAPSLASCTAPTSVVLSGTSTATAKATVTTTAAHSIAVPKAVRPFWPPGGLRVWWLFVLLFMTLAALANKAASRANQRLAHVGFAIVLLFALLCASGCTNSSYGVSSGTPAGSYTLTFSGTSGSTSHNVGVTLNVN